MYSNIKTIVKENSHESPDRILSIIREHFMSMGELYRNGEISEDDFLVYTFYDNVFTDIFEKFNLYNTREQLIDNDRFKQSWHYWKKTGTVTPFTDDKNAIWKSEQSLQKLFKVIDVCKIPLAEFDSLYATYNGQFPEIWQRICRRHYEYVLAYRCTDIHKLINDTNPVGKEFNLHFEDKIEANIFVDDYSNDNGSKIYMCRGTITDYVEKPETITIEFDKDGAMDVSFGLTKCTHWQSIARTQMSPIPHQKWLGYENARLAQRLKWESEYKILRLPYMLGISEEKRDPGKGNVILFQKK